MKTNKDVAIWYAQKMGWAVLPLHSIVNGKCSCHQPPGKCNPGKHPRTPNGVTGATTDIAQISRWWAIWPDANIGVATGEISGIVAVDIDLGHNGSESLEALEGTHGKLPDTVHALTGGGGSHYIYRYPAGRRIGNTAGKLGEGIDTRGNGGYIVVSPSNHLSGRTYEWELSSRPGEQEIAPLPAWVIGIISTRVQSNGTTGTVIPEGQRNAVLTSLAGSMRRRGQTKESIFAALMVENEKRCAPPLLTDEVEDIARSVVRYTPEATLIKTERGPRPRLVISVDIAAMTDALESQLAREHDIFQRGGSIIAVTTGGGADKKIRRDPQAVTLRKMAFASIKERAATVIEWRRAKANGDPTPAYPPDVSVQAIAARGAWATIRPLHGLASAPFVRADGSICSYPGYDSETQQYLVDGVSANVPDVITQETARQAADEIFDVVSDFPFESPAHRSAWLTWTLSSLCRSLIDGPVPALVVDGTTPGSGKSLLTDISSLICTGATAPKIAQTRDDEEMRKRLTSLAISGDQMAVLDNLTGSVGSPALDAALTCDVWQDRVMREQITVSLPWRTVVALTGNNIQPRGDLPRRVIYCRLDPQVERPEERSGFRYPDVKAHVLATRDRLVSAGLAIVAGYIRAGRPAQKMPAFGSFESWRNLIASAVVWATGVSPLESRSELQVASTSEEVAGRLLAAIYAWRGEQAITAGDLVDCHVHKTDSATAELIEEWLEPGKKSVTSSMIGRALAKIRGRYMRGLKVELKRSNRIRSYSIVPQASQVSPEKTEKNSGDTSDTTEALSQASQASPEKTEKNGGDTSDTIEVLSQASQASPDHKKVTLNKKVSLQASLASAGNIRVGDASDTSDTCFNPEGGAYINIYKGATKGSVPSQASSVTHADDPEFPPIESYDEDEGDGWASADDDLY